MKTTFFLPEEYRNFGFTKLCRYLIIESGDRDYTGTLRYKAEAAIMRSGKSGICARPTHPLRLTYELEQ
ncbi:hypothetical protein Q5691_21870 [Microcoleus sp. w1-18aA5]|uniref:hypothetical protein n=1 Tax=unclassified Microcoleus TaxID=2642155 RepID=UPI002FD5C39D